MTISVTGVPETQVTDGRGFAIRHVRPGAGEGASTVTVLGRAYGFEWLPLSTLPTSPDLVEGSYTRRLGDAGEFTLRFPNVASSKGLWREKFSEAGSLEFVEIYRDDVLEFVGSIERVEVDRGTVTISGGDGWSLLKRAYERDRTWWDAPATVIDAYTSVPVVKLAEDWADTTGWTLSNCGLAADNSGFPGDYLETPTGGSGSVSASARYATLGSSYCWYAETTIARHVGAENVTVTFAVNNSTSGPDEGAVIVTVGPNGWSSARVVAYPSTTITTFGGEASGPLPATLRIERRGRFFYGYINSMLVGVLETSYLPDAGYVFVRGDRNSGTAYVLIGPVSVTYHEPFLRRGSDRGALVLPGDYPPGGLRGRYFNYGNMQGFASDVREGRAFAPTSEPYEERLDPQINTSTVSMPVVPGAATTYWGARWTGSIYLPQSAGAVSLRVVTNGRVRAWVGDTEMDETLWTGTQGWVTGTTAADTITPTDNGWYPIRVEFIHATGTASLQLQFYRATGWTDPGGTTISNATWTVVPSTSLSPLGCHEARIQGQSHFAIIQDVAQQAGYQLLLEPMSLESGEFPGRLVPRLRVGRDTDVVLEVEDDPSAEPILTPAVTRDASDQAVRVIGAGSGSADGRGSQTIAEVADLTVDALFELQSWTDAGDATLPQLLEARLNAELALRATPWEEVRGVPRAFERLADTWPLTGTLSAMRWRPGDGLRISVPDIGVQDTDPRRLTQVTRAFAAEGRTATTVGFRQRPRSAAVALRRLAQSQALAVRSNQGTLVTLASDVVEGGIAAGSWTAFAFVSLLPQDTVRRAVLKVNQYTGTGTLSLAINGADRTTALGGSWATAPLEIDVTPYAAQASTTDNRMFARMQQTGGNAGQINMQLVVEVLR